MTPLQFGNILNPRVTNFKLLDHIVDKYHVYSVSSRNKKSIQQKQYPRVMSIFSLKNSVFIILFLQKSIWNETFYQNSWR